MQRAGCDRGTGPDGGQREGEPVEAGVAGPAAGQRTASSIAPALRPATTTNWRRRAARGDSPWLSDIGEQPASRFRNAFTGGASSRAVQPRSGARRPARCCRLCSEFMVGGGGALAGHAGHQRPRRDHRALGPPRPRRRSRPGADHRAVQHRGAHADQHGVLDGAPCSTALCRRSPRPRCVPGSRGSTCTVTPSLDVGRRRSRWARTRRAAWPSTRRWPARRGPRPISAALGATHASGAPGTLTLDGDDQRLRHGRHGKWGSRAGLLAVRGPGHAPSSTFGRADGRCVRFRSACGDPRS